MRKIVGALLLVFVLFLSGCFGSDTEEKTPVIQTEEWESSEVSSNETNETVSNNDDGVTPSDDSVTVESPSESKWSESQTPTEEQTAFVPDVFVEDAGPDPELTKGEFYDLEVDNTLIVDTDTVLGIGIFANDITAAKGNTADEETFHIWRDFLFWESNLSESDAFAKCLETGSTQGLTGVYKTICEWKDEYISDQNTNYAKIKDLFLVAKKAKETSSDNECRTLLTSDYKWSGLSAEKLNGYLFCQKVANGDSFDIKDNYFFFHKAVEIEKCEFLKDENLTKLCNDVKADFPDLTE